MKPVDVGIRVCPLPVAFHNVLEAIVRVQFRKDFKWSLCRIVHPAKNHLAKGMLKVLNRIKHPPASELGLTKHINNPGPL